RHVEALRAPGLSALICTFLDQPENIMTNTTDTAALKQAIEKFYNAIRGKNAAAFEPLLTQDVTYGHSSGRIENKAQFIANVLDPKTQWKSIYGADQT